jgi:hypothetical protein
MWTTPISEFFCNAHIHSNLNLFAVILSWICSLNNSLDPGRSSCLDAGPDGTVLWSIKWQRQNLVGPPTNMGCILISSTQMTQGSGGETATSFNARPTKIFQNLATSPPYPPNLALHDRKSPYSHPLLFQLVFHLPFVFTCGSTCNDQGMS